jgi:Uma2 family endonuclease
MEAHKLQTVADLLAAGEERVELIDGEIVRRPIAGGEHAGVQLRTGVELAPADRTIGPGGWWLVTEISVAYETHQCPTHDLAGWRKERMPERPRGVVELSPDWVCEIVSPGHERKDALTLLLPLQRHRVPFYWLIWPENRTLMAYQLDGEHYRLIATIAEPARVRVPPFDALGLDLAYMLGD